MNVVSQPEPLDCPTENLMAMFSVGKLTAEQIAKVSSHVENCSVCATLLDSVQGASDTVVARLGKIGWDDSTFGLFEEPEYRRLNDRAKALLADDKRSSAEHDLQTPRPPAAYIDPDAESNARSIDTTLARPFAESHLTETFAHDASGPVAEHDNSDPAKIGTYEVLSRLSSGGMGVVYRAYQRSVDRAVAVKMILPEKVSPALLQRFKTECTAIGRLQHPNVINIIEAGEHEGNPFFSMELAGDNLEDRLAVETISDEEAARLSSTLARAIHYAHEKGILHRDLKPSNILFAAEDVPKIGDFGLAKIFDAHAEPLRNITEEDAVLGTPHYMSPEQARGETKNIGPATDIHALGAILYRLIAGRPPFVGENKLETIAAVSESAADRPSRHRPSVCADLDAICMQCLAKSPQDRYASAAALADDLELWLAGKRSLALDRLRSRSRRRWMIGIAAAVTLPTSALLLPRRESTEEKAENQLRRLHAQLSQRQRTTVVGARGLPAWYQWNGATDAVLTEDSPDGIATLRSRGATLMALLNDPQCDAYRIDVDMRHNHAGPLVSAAGIFVGHWKAGTADKQFHACSLVRFNELYNEQAAHALLARNQKDSGHALPPPPVGSAVRLCPYVLIDHGGVDEEDFELAGSAQRYQRDLRGGRWRRLAIEFRPTSIKAFFDHSPIPMDMLKAEFEDRTRAQIQNHGVPANPSQPMFDPRGAVGVYVKDGEISFRNVVIQPL